jgi:hypothetical protein
MTVAPYLLAVSTDVRFGVSTARFLTLIDRNFSVRK